MHKLKLILFFFVSVTLWQNAFSQKQTNNWYFGDHAGINFNTVPPQPITGGAITSWEGCASISDSIGNLLMYTNGVTVWNASHEKMLNGEGLFGDTSSTESAIIIPKPGNSFFHYIFTVDKEAGDSGLCYSIVDMRLDGGKGGITDVKNIEILSPVPEKVTSVYHANGKDIWIVSHKWGNSEFYAWLLTENGLSNDPIISDVGTPHVKVEENPNYTLNPLGYMKCSPNGKKLALALLRSSIVEVFDFNDDTGKLTNPLTIPFHPYSTYGIEFSPDCSKLYIAAEKRLFQANLAAGTNEDIKNSVLEVANLTALTGAIQLATDGKAYLAINRSSYLGVINEPDSLGLKCNFIEDGFFLNSGMSRMGLPDFMQSYFLPATFRISGNCTGSNIGFIISASAVNDSVSWDFGDPESDILNYSDEENPSHIYTNSGHYSVTLTHWVNGQAQNVSESINISVPDLALGNDTILCPDYELVLDAFSDNCNYTWQDLSSSSEYTVNLPGTYYVDIFNTITSCSNTDTINVTYSSTPELSLESDTLFCKDTEFKLNAYHYKYSYLWSTSETDSVITISEPGEYSVIVTDSLFCLNTDTILLSHYPLPVFSLGNDSSICVGTQYNLVADPNFVNYFWNDGSTNSSNLISNFGEYRLFVSDSVGCTFSDTIQISQASIFTPRLPTDTTLCYGEELAIDFIEDGVVFYTGSGANDETTIWTEYGLHTVVAANKCGESISSMNLHFKFCGEIYIPNVITPNNDKINDLFHIQGISETNWKILIYSRWGGLVYESDNYLNDWKADNCTGGTYYYILFSEYFDNSFSGWVQVIK